MKLTDKQVTRTQGDATATGSGQVPGGFSGLSLFFLFLLLS